MPNTLITQKQSERFMLLNAMYKKCDANTNSVCDARELSQECGLNFNQFKSAFDFLAAHKLIEPYAYNEHDHYLFRARMRQKGIYTLEEAFRKEDEPTEFFIAVRDLHL